MTANELALKALNAALTHFGIDEADHLLVKFNELFPE